MKGIFLIAKYTQRPKNPRMTHVKSYMADPDNMQWDEQVLVASRVRDKDMTQSQVILNLVEGVVVRNSISLTKDFPAVFNHFYKEYKKYIHDAVSAINPNLELVVPSAEETPDNVASE